LTLEGAFRSPTLGPATVTSTIRQQTWSGPTAPDNRNETVFASPPRNWTSVLLQVEEMLTVKFDCPGRRRPTDLRQLLDGLGGSWQRPMVESGSGNFAQTHFIRSKKAEERTTPRLAHAGAGWQKKLHGVHGKWKLMNKTKLLHAPIDDGGSKGVGSTRSPVGPATMVDAFGWRTQKKLLDASVVSTLLESVSRKWFAIFSRDQVKEVDLVMQGGDV